MLTTVSKSFLSNMGFICFCILTGMSSCVVNKSDYLVYPENFRQFSDFEKSDWWRDHLSPDSVARLTCDLFCQRDTSLSIENLNKIIFYTYTNYKDKDRYLYATTLNGYVDSLPAYCKMKIYLEACEKNGRKLGYEYAKEINNHPEIFNQGKINSEIEALKYACEEDSGIYWNFINTYNRNLLINN